MCVEMRTSLVCNQVMMNVCMNSGSNTQIHTLEGVFAYSHLHHCTKTITKRPMCLHVLFHHLPDNTKLGLCLKARAAEGPNFDFDI